MIRVLLVDDQELVRSGFRVILDSEPGMEVVGEAATGAAAVELAATLAPDVICMDIEMPQMDGIEAARRILAGAGPGGVNLAGATAKGSAPGTSGADAVSERPPAILVLTTFGHERYLFDALAAGVSGFLLKTARAEQLIDAVKTLAQGDALLGPDVTRAVIERLAGGRETTDSGAETSRPSVEAVQTAAPSAMDASGFSEREAEVLTLMAQGKSNREIASQLFLGEATVKTHVSSILRKLGVRDRIQAVVWAHSKGVV